MRRTKHGKPEALVSRATLLASLPVVRMRKQSTAFSVTDWSTCRYNHTSALLESSKAGASSLQPSSLVLTDGPADTETHQQHHDMTEAGSSSSQPCFLTLIGQPVATSTCQQCHNMSEADASMLQPPLSLTVRTQQQRKYISSAMTVRGNKKGRVHLMVSYH